MMKPSAIGYVRHVISGLDRFRDQTAIQDLARDRGYDLLPLLTVGPSVPAPELLLFQHIISRDTNAVIVPSQEHIWSSRRTVTEYCDLIVASGGQIWKRGHRWPPLAFNPRPGSTCCLPGSWF